MKYYDKEQHMFIEERHQEIINIINDIGRISIGEIQEKFDVSVESARRDLRILEEKGLLKRTHGGAIPVMKVGLHLPQKWDPLKMTVLDNYNAIARKAVEFINPDDAVYITGGSVGYLMLKHLPTSFPMTVVVNSVDAAVFLKDRDNVSVYIAGGKMRPNGRIVDAFAQEFVRNMHFDVSFLTGAGFAADFGISNGTPETAAFHRIIAENSRINIALFPHQKIGFHSFLKDADINKFDTLITDWDAVEEELMKFEDLGINVVVVDKEN
jgi:DeoR/GlpR family transcriptional regulator of sugar metabolism